MIAATTSVDDAATAATAGELTSVSFRQHGRLGAVRAVHSYARNEISMAKKSERKGRVRWDSELGGYYGWVQIFSTRWQRKTIGCSTPERAVEFLVKAGLLKTNIEIGPEAPAHERPLLVR